MPPLLVVAGLAREAACLGEGVVPVLSGADVGVLRVTLAQHTRHHYAAVVSFGLAGGLDPNLRPGDVVAASTVVGEDGTTEAHPAFAETLLQNLNNAGLPAHAGAIAGVDAPVMNCRAKVALRARTGARAVDMESHLAAEFARARGLPFVALRAISDPAERSLPPLAARAVKPDGGIDLVLVLRELARAPRQLGDLMAAGRDSGAAFASLRRCGPMLVPLPSLVLAELG
jgi:adenosylhomocysteine nucleosidase